ncbi:MAG: hypothetical protein ISP83_05770 [Candidatus Poseidonia sp.]|nr:hypothetical protein [Poseidonia sp.]MBL6747495.1 hypothetical protein [Poseidonia sp.]MBL6806364.1 hypothetical protein [Poseidonia sp.]MBL6885784.1 hypothetical protein [Poseidonia sp.]MBL6892469.1 hypothetical protein [Poseidonia sp.]
MRQTLPLLLSLLFLASFLPTSLAAGSEGGQDVNPDESEVPFSVVERTTPSQDGTSWSLTVQLDDEAQANGTTIAITTQICLNNGVCNPPEVMESTAEDGTYSASISPPEDHSYVNWRVKATYEDESTENFPQGDWYKTWSTCYFEDGSYGGIHADGDGCNVPSSGEEGEGLLPSIGIGVVMTVLVCAAYVRRQ